jgi:putative membrane protein
MHMRWQISVILLALTLPAAAQSLGEKTGVNSWIGKSPTTQDFVTEAANSDMFEIQSSQLALQKSSDQTTKSFANQMVTDHTKTSAELKSMVANGAVRANLPNALDSSHQDMLDMLNSLNGDDFTKQYDKDQVDGHKDAVDLFKRYAKGGDSDVLKRWAVTTLPTLQHHLDMASNLKQ